MHYFEKLCLINSGLNRAFRHGNTPFHILSRLMEECGELAEQVHIFEDSGVKRRKHGEPDPLKMAKEIQVVIGCALQVAEYYKIMPDLKQAIDDRFQKWQKDGWFINVGDPTRPELNHEGVWPPRNVVCVGAVVLKDKSVLLVRQGPGTSLAGQWSLPWGVVESNEFPDIAILRETIEEAAITAELIGLLGVQNLNWRSAIGLAFLCRHVEGQPTADEEETDAARYFTLRELDELNEPIESWTEWLARRVLNDQHTLIPLETDNPFRPQAAFF